MVEMKIVASTDAIVVSTAICAGGMDPQHSEGIVDRRRSRRRRLAEPQRGRRRVDRDRGGRRSRQTDAEGIALTTSIAGAAIRPTMRRAS